MKKRIIMVLFAAFAVGCTTTSIEEHDYDHGIQLIDKDEALSPDDIREKAKSEDE